MESNMEHSAVLLDYVDLGGSDSCKNRAVGELHAELRRPIGLKGYAADAADLRAAVRGHLNILAEQAHRLCGRLDGQQGVGGIGLLLHETERGELRQLGEKLVVVQWLQWILE